MKQYIYISFILFFTVLTACGTETPKNVPTNTVGSTDSEVDNQVVVPHGQDGAINQALNRLGQKADKADILRALNETKADANRELTSTNASLKEKEEEKNALETQKANIYSKRKTYGIWAAVGLFGGVLGLPIMFIPYAGVFIALALWIIICPIAFLVGVIGSIVWWTKPTNNDKINEVSQEIKKLNQQETDLNNRVNECTNLANLTK